MSDKSAKEKMKEFWREYEMKIVTFVGLVLISVISFELGVLKGGRWQKDPLIIEKPASIVCETTANKSVLITSEKKEEESQSECQFVGSKNSNKYHPTTDCQWADRIKEENKVCFKNKKDAESKGYIQSSCFR